ncbi:Na+/H+ antiporter-like protein Nha1 [Venturia nashicola]|uniref:Na+/H+ antiporter-like protein Nha1 n=1 Tax=Venturia nashicola TaxID=86259 RepID=A0A4Z1NRG6_9PEZI|nr:Na+/H+ antiporter-like protein Nha1 [Venturia nashicola]TLD29400.1 Na+/H+ antiporter-like protein Nha1 [Venturia nashicola]
MAWEHLDVNRPHLVYIILGGFTSIFMLCSSLIKEKLYIGEATVATLCGIIFGPHAANLIDPGTWGNTDQITLEFSRIVLVVQCFAVGVELPRFYMEKHWKSVTFLLIPVMTFGWLVTSLFIWWMFGARLNWLDSLCIAACVTATDPVLASSVVGKGKFAKRVPKHLRDLLSAESGCNDGMAFPFIYLAVYLIRYRPDANEVAFHWFCYSVLYECVFGAFYGVAVGYIARRAIRYAHDHDLVDRESFLVFYFVLALFCAGSGSILGMDDLLVGFACGVGFSNDGWFQEKTEESHVSNVIDLLINLAFFVYFGTIIPWQQYNSDVLGISPWRLVVVGILVIFFRRIPIMLALKPIIPDIKTWREALFAGHFGPIGVGAIFVAILARAELETETTTPLAELPESGFEHLNIIEMIWPITTFLVIVSIIIHGSSVAVFTLGKHINTLTLTLSYTQANDDGPSWMDRLPRIQSRSKSSMSMGRPNDTESSLDEKMEEGVMGMPAQFLRRQREEDEKGGSRVSSDKPYKRKKWDAGIGPGGPVSKSAIAPVRHRGSSPQAGRSEPETLAIGSGESPEDGTDQKGYDEPEEEVYQEGSKQIIEDEDGNVLEVRDGRGESKQERDRQIRKDGTRLMQERHIQHGIAEDDDEEHDDSSKPTGPPGGASKWHDVRKKMEAFGGGLGGLRKVEDNAGPSKAPQQKKPGPALAYQFGNTIIVEDEDGEVIKKYDIPSPQKPARPGMTDRKQSIFDPATRDKLHRMGTWIGMGHHEGAAGPSGEGSAETKKSADSEDDDTKIRFRLGGVGRRMSKAEFIQQISSMDPKSRAKVVESSDAPEALKRHIKAEASKPTGSPSNKKGRPSLAGIEQVASSEERARGPEGLTLVDSNQEDIPFHPVGDQLSNFSFSQGRGETAAQRRRRGADAEDADVDDDDAPRGRLGQSTSSERPEVVDGQGTFFFSQAETAAEKRRRLAALGPGSGEPSPSRVQRPVGAQGLRPDGTRGEGSSRGQGHSYLEAGETAAEKRRRLAALGGDDDDSSSSDEEGPGRAERDPIAAATRRQLPRRPEPALQSGNRDEPTRETSARITFADGGAPTRSSAAPSNRSSGAGDRASGEGGHSRHGSHGMRLRWGADVGTKPGEGSNDGGKGKKK